MLMKKIINPLLNRMGLKKNVEIITLYPLPNDKPLSPIVSFSEELNNFLKNADINKISHQLIIQAYLDIIRLCYKENITYSHKQEIQEFRDTIDQAISKSDQKIKSI